MRNIALVVCGVSTIGFAVREMFHDLFHPSRGGSLSEFIARRIFAVLRRWPRSLSLAGPLALVMIIFSWALLLAAGFALVYLAIPPQAYQLEAGMLAPRHGFWAAFYFSLEVMTTLGLGDIKPKPEWLRVLVTLHTLVGFALVTASLTWVVLIYPALARVRALASAASMLAEAERRTGIGVVREDSANLLSDLASAVVRFRIDLVNFPIVYYFRAQHENACMARSLGYIDRFARDASGAESSERLRFAGCTLVIALERAAVILRERFTDVDVRDRAAVFRKYAEYHVRTLGV